MLKFNDISLFQKTFNEFEKYNLTLCFAVC